MELQLEQNQDKLKSRIIAAVLFLILLLLLLIPILHFQNPPPEREGVLISFGEPDKGDGADRPKVQNTDPNQKKTEEKKAEKKVEEKKEVVKEQKKRPQPKQKVAPKAAAPKVLTSKEKAEINLKSAENKQKAERALVEQKRQEKARADAAVAAEAKRVAAAEAAAAAAKKAEFDKAKSQFGDFLSGSGKGETGTKGNQGDPTGDPDANKLKGVSKGSGRVGGGLSNRGLVSEPEVKDNSQETGKVVMEVCVNSNGKVQSANFTQRGSTSLSGNLIKKAKDACYKYKFSAAEIEEQCGTITFIFKVE